MSNKTYPIPVDLHELFMKHMDNYSLHVTLCSTGTYKEAMRYRKKSNKLKTKFWRKVYQLYPFFDNYRLRYDSDTRTVSAIGTIDEDDVEVDNET